MSEEQKKLVEKWLEKASHDLLAAQTLIKHEPLILDTACFHCQQAVEKYLKSFLVFKNHDFPKLHDVAVLKKMCAELDPEFEIIDVFEIDEYAVRIRYPDDYNDPDMTDTLKYLEVAIQIKELVLRKIVWNKV